LAGGRRFESCQPDKSPDKPRFIRTFFVKEHMSSPFTHRLHMAYEPKFWNLHSILVRGQRPRSRRYIWSGFCLCWSGRFLCLSVELLGVAHGFGWESPGRRFKSR